MADAKLETGMRGSAYGLVLLIAAIVLIVVKLPSHVWDAADSSVILTLGSLAAWRYGWWLMHLVRANIYARLVFPTEAWRFTSLLKPTSGSLLAAMADVAQPWKQRVATTFTGSGTKTFKLPLTLDGAFTLQLSGPHRAQYDLIVRSGGKVEDRTSSSGSSDRIHYRIACRDRRTENLSITVIRRSGGTGGAYSLKASYAG